MNIELRKIVELIDEERKKTADKQDRVAQLIEEGDRDLSNKIQLAHQTGRYIGLIDAMLIIYKYSRLNEE